MAESTIDPRTSLTSGLLAFDTPSLEGGVGAEDVRCMVFCPVETQLPPVCYECQDQKGFSSVRVLVEGPGHMDL